MCHFICNHSYFGNVVLVCIMVSSAMLAAEDPLNSNSERNRVSDNLRNTTLQSMRDTKLSHLGHAQTGGIAS